MKKIVNPFLPSFEYIPDGEPRVFGDRIYLYGSHDRFDGADFCLNDYVAWSAPVEDLSNWRYEGVIYKKINDPRNQVLASDLPEPVSIFGVPKRRENSMNPPGIHAQWAPDVIQGKDGNYYLYYCLDFLPEIAVAFCNQPAGEFQFLGLVQYPDGTPLGRKAEDYIQFDPGIFIDDDGEIYLYSGNAPLSLDHLYYASKQMSQVMTLCDDMVTLKSLPQPLMCDVRNSQNTTFHGHEFFEASSIRKIDERYYFIYSSVRSHELCYAISDYPDRDFKFGGVLVSIGDIGLGSRTIDQSLMPLGNTHGSLAYCAGQWYIFYHRQTNRTNFSRQACAEKIDIDQFGNFNQVEITSTGLSPTYLMLNETYGAYSCCHLTRNNRAIHSHPNFVGMHYPFLTQEVGDIEPTLDNIEKDKIYPFQFVTNIQDQVTFGYKYFDFKEGGVAHLHLKLRKCQYEPNPNLSIFEQKVLSRNMGIPAENIKKIDEDIRLAPLPNGLIRISTSPKPSENQILGTIKIENLTTDWTLIEGRVDLPAGIYPLYVNYIGVGALDCLTIGLFTC